MKVYARFVWKEHCAQYFLIVGTCCAVWNVLTILRNVQFVDKLSRSGFAFSNVEENVALYCGFISLEYFQVLVSFNPFLTNTSHDLTFSCSVI